MDTVKPQTPRNTAVTRPKRELWAVLLVLNRVDQDLWDIALARLRDGHCDRCGKASAEITGHWERTYSPVPPVILAPTWSNIPRQLSIYGHDSLEPKQDSATRL